MSSQVDALVTRRVGGVDLVAAKPAMVARLIAKEASQGSLRGRHVHLVNAYSIVVADTRPEVAEVFRGQAVNFPDGKPISWVSRARRDRPALSQVRGPSLFRDVFDLGRDYGLTHYLLGATDDVLVKLQSRVEELFPGVRIVGTESPPFRPLTASERAAQDARISSSGADVVWVGLGTPKQDLEAARIARDLPVVAIAIGAAFDFTAGTLQEAPPWVTRVGVEWMFRLAREPRRLWRRYVFGNLRFIRLCLQAWEGQR